MQLGLVAKSNSDAQCATSFSGRGRLDGLAIAAGDRVWPPPGESHVLYAETEVVIHVTLPGPVVVTEQA